MKPLKKWMQYMKHLIDAPHDVPEDPLYLAARAGDIPKVFSLLRSYRYAVGGREWQSVTRTACLVGQSELLAALLTEATNVLPESLVIASECSHTECVRVLMAHNINPNVPLANGTTALMAAAGISSGIFSYRKKDIPEAPAEEDSSATHQRGIENLLYSLADSSGNYSGHVPHCCVEILELLLRHGADPNLENVKNNTALIGAAICGNVEAVTLLVKAGADVNCSNHYRYSALKIATLKGDTEIVYILQQTGARE